MSPPAQPAGRTHVLVMAKAPVPGRSKTRLTPPFSAQQAAEVACCALAETLENVARCGADRMVVALDGDPGPWLPPGFEVIPQILGPFDERLAAAWETVGGPGIQIGMDTPQLTAADLDDALDRLLRPRVDAVLGPAHDGGWWAIGLRDVDGEVFRGVPMSTASTGRAQLARLRGLGRSVSMLACQRDLDTAEDAVALVASRPGGTTAQLLCRLLATVPPVRAQVRREAPPLAPVGWPDDVAS